MEGNLVPDSISLSDTQLIRGSLGRYVAVHQFDAHAWAEVWFENDGWVRVDPTSIVSPERIERGLESAVEGEATFLADVGLSLMKFRSTLWITEIRLQISALNHYWDAWVVGYTPTMQMNLVARYFGDLDRQSMGVLLLSSFFGLLGIIGGFLLLKRSTSSLPAVEQVYLRYCRLLAKEGLERRFGEGPMDYAQRVRVWRPELTTAVDTVVSAYLEANYISDNPDSTSELKRAIATLRTRMFLKNS